MEHPPVDQMASARDALSVPAALDHPASGRRFTAEGMAQKVRVLFIVQHPTVTPAISVHANLIRHFDPERVQVHVVYNRLAAQEPHASGGASVLDLLRTLPDVRLRSTEFGPIAGGHRLALLAAAARALGPAIRDSLGLVRYIHRHQIDVIHCEEGARNGFYALAASRVTRAKCVMHLHLKYADWMSRWSRFAVHHADAVISVSSWTGRSAAQAGVPPERIFPVLNGIDTDGWDPSAVDGAEVRREFHLEAGTPLVVMIAQLAGLKRQTTLIEAFGQVVQSHPDARLLIVGQEWSQTGTAPSGYAEKLAKLVVEAGLEESVSLLGQRRDVRQILAAADIFALPSVDDSCALALIEAMAMAKPIVAVQAGGTPELVQAGQSGLLGPADDSAQLAGNIIALIEDPARRGEMGAHGRRHALEHLTAQRMADHVEAVYRHVLGAARTPG